MVLLQFRPFPLPLPFGCGLLDVVYSESRELEKDLKANSAWSVRVRPGLGVLMPLPLMAELIRLSVLSTLSHCYSDRLGSLLYLLSTR